jgi:hypothetical protein
MLLAGTFTGLDPASRIALSDWLDGIAAREGARVIDTVMDLSHRPWQVFETPTVIGVFEHGRHAATWLIIGYQSEWTLAQCEDGLVSGTYPTLGEILRLIDAGLYR